MKRKGNSLNALNCFCITRATHCIQPVCYPNQWRIYIVKFWMRAPPRGPNSFNFMQFLGKFGKIVCWRPPWRVGAPSSGKSWIRHCQPYIRALSIGSFKTLLLGSLSIVSVPLSSGESRIFLAGGPTHKSGCTNLLFCKFFAENCMKMKEIGPQGGGGARVHAPSLDPSVLSVVDLHTN